MKIFKLILSSAMLVAVSLTLSMPAHAKDKFQPIKKMEREFIMAVTAAAGKTYPDFKITQARVSTGDCPGTCADSTLGGMCYCEPDSEGNCGAGETKTTRGGKPACKIKPTTASVIFNGRDEPARILGVNDF